MKVTALIENTAKKENLGSEHGLSLYIETGETKLLFDAGASGLFLKNAEELGVDIADVDALIISHGHYDHGGGIPAFLEANKKAKVYVHPGAFEPHVYKEDDGEAEDIGLKADLTHHPRIVYTDDLFALSEGAQLFAGVQTVHPRPSTNRGLLMLSGGEAAEDRFLHEQNLILDEGGRSVLFTGCSHNGILNILERYKALRGRMPDAVFGGFHLTGGPAGQEKPEELQRIGEFLVQTGARFYTGHCTGTEVYKQLKEQMGDRVEYFAGGCEAEV